MCFNCCDVLQSFLLLFSYVRALAKSDKPSEIREGQSRLLVPGGDRGNRDKLGVVDRDWGELGRQNRAGDSGDRDEGERLGWNLKNNQSCIKIQ